MSSAATSTELERHVIDVPNCKKLVVYVQGDLTKKETKCVFMTVNDLASNHMTWVKYLENDAMKEATERSIFLHVVAPGQDDNDDDLPEPYPTMQQISEDLPVVLDKLGVKLAICLGEGAGANILLRFGLSAPSRCIGLVLVHCNPDKSGFMENLKDKVTSWKSEQYLIDHKFGNMGQPGANADQLIKEYQDRLKTTINPRNLRKYVDAYLKRTSVMDKLDKLALETLLLVGTKSTHVKAVENMYQIINKGGAKKPSSLIKLEDVGDVLTEVPERVAQSLLLFCKGLGVLTSVPIGLDRQRTFSGSSQGGTGAKRPGMVRQATMSEHDTPNLRRFSTIAFFPPTNNSNSKESA